MMETRIIKISKGQHLADIYPLIETNIILNKRLSGIGATHCEIIAPRHSIIVVPNVPIITCKVEKHKDSDNLLGVMANISVRDIEQYLEATLSTDKLIKIMVTPESFYKVRKAFNEVAFNMYDVCFLMLDECHKFIKERDFREEIVQPLHSFFKFKNKALVSATPLTPSDPRFDEQGFKKVVVEPDWRFLNDILIICADDIRGAFYTETVCTRRGELPKEPQCIFVNSISIIANLITDSNLEEISSIFCSEQSAVELRQRGFKNVHTEWKNEYEKPYMFFTSRFFTGLDIWLEKKPRVLYFSDAKNAEQTLMDPYTDMAQACGRFRNGMKEIYHFVNFNTEIERKSKEDIEEYVNGIIKSHIALQDLLNKSHNKFEKQAITKILGALPFKEIFFEDEIDYFMKDHITDSERVKQYYNNWFSLQTAYGNSGYFRNPDIDDSNCFPPIPAELKKIPKRSRKEIERIQRIAIVETLSHIAPYYKTSAINDIIYTLRANNKLMVDAFFQLGKDFIERCEYNPKIIKEELLNRKGARVTPDEAFFNTLYSSFEIGKKYLCSEAKKELQRIYDKFLLTPPSIITSKSLRWHFEIDDKARIGNQKAIKILRRKADGITKYFEEIKNNTETKPLSDFED